ncbi:hypothetical protein JXJ21_16820 [candidate division KSB1 bacterium]|nr:hypothetical protein [candidate division KSB1 bacterium]
MKKIKQNCIIPSAAFSAPNKLIKQYIQLPERTPEMGDLMYGEVSLLGHHTTLESVSARIHTIHDRTRAVFVFGTRYAPDQFEGFVPQAPSEMVDLIARSGLVGEMKCHNELISSPTKVRLLGYVADDAGNVVNTRDYVLIRPKKTERNGPGARVILCIGTSMNSGKSRAAAACCYAFSSIGKIVRAAKITGTSSLKDILLMQDCGAQHIADFSYFGFPSTYMLELEDLKRIFHGVDMKYGNDPKNYLVLEFADGIFQRETAMLLQCPEVRSRIHKLVFCGVDAAGIVGGLQVLKSSFDLIPDAISGLCSSSPLALREIASFTDIPILRSMERDFKAIYNIIR